MPRRLPLLVLVAALLLSACSGDTPVSARRAAAPPVADCNGGMMGSDGRCIYPIP